MKKALKWIGIVLGILIVVLIVAVGGLYFTSKSRLDTAPEVAVTMIDIPTDEAALARGEHLATSSAFAQTVMIRG